MNQPPIYLEMSPSQVIQRMRMLLGDVHIHDYKLQVYDATLSEKQRIKALINWSREC